MRSQFVFNYFKFFQCQGQGFATGSLDTFVLGCPQQTSACGFVFFRFLLMQFFALSLHCSRISVTHR